MASPQKTSKKRSLLVLTIVGIVILAGTWVTNFLTTFDLNDYRQDAEEQLASLLGLPVTIADIHYNLHNTKLALRFSGVRIGDPTTQLEAQAPDIVIELQWRGLLMREIRFSRISLDAPTLWLRPIAQDTTVIDDTISTPRPWGIDPAALASTTIKKFDVRHASVHIEDPALHDPRRAIHITAVDGRFDNIGLDRETRFAMEGKLQVAGQQTPSSWALSGSTTLAHSDLEDILTDTELSLQGKDLDLQALNSLASDGILGLAGTADLELAIKKTSGAPLALQLQLSSEKMTVLPYSQHSTPIPFKRLQASTSLQIDDGLVTLQDLSVELDRARLSGQVAWQAPPKPFSLTIDLKDVRAPTAQIRGWLPDHTPAWQRSRQKLQANGKVDIDVARLVMTDGGEQPLGWRIDRLAGRLEGIQWALKDDRIVEITALPFLVVNDEWQFDNSQLRLGSLEIIAGGKGRYKEGSLVVDALDVSGNLSPAPLLDEWGGSLAPLVTRGDIPVRGHLAGPLSMLTIDLQADLSQLELEHPAGFSLVPAAQDNVSLHATLTPERLSLDHGAIKWALLKGHIAGHYPLEAPDDLAFEALLSIDDLTRLAESIPLLKKMALHGQADLSISQHGPLEKNPPETVLTLRQAGLRAIQLIADIQNINGRIHVTPAGLRGKNLQAHLGESLFSVDLQLDNFSNPQLGLDVKSPAVRARDVIFRSTKSVLRDVTGHLDINREGLTFAPVDTRLDGGTNATVKGTIAFKPPYPVNLDITSDYALLSEVIGLWTDAPSASEPPEPAEAESSEPPKPFVPITITARVTDGDLYGMTFHDATGIITPTRERLIIHPLDFSVGEGYCNAQVLVDFPRESPVSLRISGHAEDVDALEVYRELLNQKSIVRGKLRGDFHLTGQTGKDYIPTTNGQFNVEVREGVLHQFQILSKVFSLLNISQIFALQLPDMDREGMPFDVMTADFHLDRGILSTDNLAIKSRAMNQSYQGQMNLDTREIDLAIAMHPLGTLDKVISRIPVAGWLLTGKDKALLTAHFSATGSADDVTVNLMPLDTLTEPTIGLLRRTLGLPFKLLESPEILWGGQEEEPPDKED